MKKRIKNIILQCRCFADSERGTTAIEFAMIAGVYLSLVFGVLETGRAFYIWNTFQQAVESGARYALVTDNVTEQQVTDFVNDKMQSVTSASNPVSLDITFDTISGVNFINIDGTYNFHSYVPLLPESWNSIALTTSSRLPIP